MTEVSLEARMLRGLILIGVFGNLIQRMWNKLGRQGALRYLFYYHHMLDGCLLAIFPLHVCCCSVEGYFIGVLLRAALSYVCNNVEPFSCFGY